MRAIRRVILESPYKGKSEDPKVARLETIRNLEYARSCVRDCAVRYGESAYASHLILTQEGILHDNVPEERDFGIQLGFVWREVADASVFYTDFGVSVGMQLGLEDAQKKEQPHNNFRTLPEKELRLIEHRHAARLKALQNREKSKMLMSRKA